MLVAYFLSNRTQMLLFFFNRSHPIVYLKFNKMFYSIFLWKHSHSVYYGSAFVKDTYVCLLKCIKYILLLILHFKKNVHDCCYFM